jgi:two-component system, OmpR family, alkaline phosphatase synthesis response regulator PhoP
MNRSPILIVEDNVALQFGLKLSLESEGYDVLVAHSVSSAIAEIKRARPALVLLDLMLPDGDGLDLLRMIKLADPTCAVIIMSAKGLEADRVKGLRLGANDYLTKPFSVPELLERIKLRLEDRAPRRSHLQLGDVTIDLDQHVVIRSGKRLPLTRQEIRLLHVLARNLGICVSRNVLLAEAWGYPPDTNTRTLDYFVTSLRRKLEVNPEEPKHLVTVRGVGYQLLS